MTGPRAIIGFAVRFGLCYGLLAAPWPGLQNAYSAGFRILGGAVFRGFGPGGHVEFLPAAIAYEGGADTEIVTGADGVPVVGVNPVGSRLMFYLPLAETAALILAANVSWRRRGIALGSGLLLALGFVVLRLWVVLMVWFSDERPWAIYQIQPWARALLSHADEVLNTAPTATFLVPVLIWIVVVFRREDWDRIIGARAAGQPTG